MPANHYRQQMLKKKQQQQQKNSNKAKSPSGQQLLKEKEERERLKAAKKSEEERILSFGFRNVPKGTSKNSTSITNGNSQKPEKIENGQEGETEDNENNDNQEQLEKNKEDKKAAKMEQERLERMRSNEVRRESGGKQNSNSSSNFPRPEEPLPSSSDNFNLSASHLNADPESHSIDVSGLRGIVNLGNTCFINAALQALAHITPLRMYFIRTYFRRIRNSAEVSADALFDAFIKAMWSSTSSSGVLGSSEGGGGIRRKSIDSYGLSTDTVSTVVTKGLVAFTWRRFPWLHPGEQHDAQEFLRCFLNELHDALKTVDMRSLMLNGGDDYQKDDKRKKTQKSKKGSSCCNELILSKSQSSRAADRARLKELAQELLAMASYEEVVNRHGRLYRSKLDAFIRLTIKLTEIPSDDEEEDINKRENGSCFLLESSSSHQESDDPDIQKTSESANCCCTSRPHHKSSCSSSSSNRSSPSNSPQKGSKRRSKISSQKFSASHHYHEGSPWSSLSSSNRTIDSRSIISDIFTGQLENTVRCTVCDAVSVTVEPFQDLSIPISVIDRAMKGRNKNGEVNVNRRVKSATSSNFTNKVPPHSSNSINISNTFSTSTLSSIFNSFLSTSSSLLFGSSQSSETPTQLALFSHYFDYFFSWLQWLGRLFIPPAVHLDDCLDVFFNPEALEKDNRYSCDRCGRLTNGFKSIRIKKLPEVLTIHLNRYQMTSGHASSLQKITTNLQFPLVDFDVGRYLAVSDEVEEKDSEDDDQDSEDEDAKCNSPRKFSESQKIPTVPPEPSANYELVAVICHQGAQLTTGHYTAYALNDLNFEWYEYDDVRVRHCQAEEVQSAAASNAYILFYQRMSASPLAGAASYPSFETYAEELRNSSQDPGSSRTMLSKSQAAMNLCTDLEQLWLERYWKYEEGSSKNPFADYYFFSQNMSSLVACFNQNSGTGSSSTTFSNSLNSSYGNFIEATLNEQSVTISRYWLNLFLTVADPGPIDNGDLYCRHRRIRPTEWMFFNSLAVPLIEPVGRLLLALYGGGPTMSRLRILDSGNDSGNPGGNPESLALEDSPICVICSTTLNEFRERRREEWSRWAMLQSVPGMVFKRLKLRKTESVIHFEMLEEEEVEEMEAENEKDEHGNEFIAEEEGVLLEDPDKEVDNFEINKTLMNGKKSSSCRKLDVMDSLDDTEVNEELNYEKPILTEEVGDTAEPENRNGVLNYKNSEEIEDNKNFDLKSTSEIEVEEAVEVNPSQKQMIISGTTRKVVSKQSNPPTTNLYEEYPIDEEPTQYYLISAEWIQSWFNFVNVDWGSDLTSARNRQLMAIYQKIISQDSGTSQNHHSSSGSSPFRHSLLNSDFHSNPYPQQNPIYQMNPNHQHHLPHPPFSSLIRAVGGGGAGGSLSTSTSSHRESSHSARNLQEQQLWSQLDFHHHTVLPPGPIDNWSLFGIKRKLLSELKKLRQTKTSTFSEPTTYNELAALLARCLRRESDKDEGGEDSHLESPQNQTGSSGGFRYSFAFTGRLHGGISEENRSCTFYLLSPEYWNLFSTAYGGGGPVFTFDYRDVEQKFSVNISVADVEHFIRHHFKGGFGGTGSNQNHQKGLNSLDHRFLNFPMILDHEEDKEKNGSSSQSRGQVRKGSTSAFDTSANSEILLRRRRTVSASAASK